MDSLTWVLVAILAIVGVVAVVSFRQRQRNVVQSQLTSLAQQVGQLSGLLQDQLRNLSEQVGRQLSTTAELLQRQDGTLGERLTAVQGVVADVRERLGTLTETGRHLTELAQDIASLQEILRAPKTRGAFGEFLLSDLLAEMLPRDRFRLQYAFAGGETVDAVIFLEGMTVPVDAKFPLPSFERLMSAQTPDERRRERRALLRDAKKHVDAIAQKYIRPTEGTTDFALMYIPAEGVYHELLVREENEDDFIAYAWSRRVVPCSPNTFYSYLRSVAMGLKGLALARNVRAVLGELTELGGKLEKLAEEFSILGNHLNNASKKYADVEKMLREVEGRLSGIAASQMP